MDEFTADQLEAISWRIAADLVRRHPDLRVLRTFPGGGQYDCLTLIRRDGSVGQLDLNRVGAIHVLQRFDRAAFEADPLQWTAIAQLGRAESIQLLEQVAGLWSPGRVPPSTTVGLIYRILAAIVGAGVDSSSPIRVHLGYVDSAGTDGGRSGLLDRFEIGHEFMTPDEQFGEPGFHFWVVTRAAQALMAFDEHTSLAWTVGNTEPIRIDQRQGSWIGQRPTAIALRLLMRATGEIR